jgi:hypothetical protein
MKKMILLISIIIIYELIIFQVILIAIGSLNIPQIPFEVVVDVFRILTYPLSPHVLPQEFLQIQ